MEKKLIIILGGSLAKANGVWHTTMSSCEGDKFGGLWCRLRVLAAHALYLEWRNLGHDVTIVALGGRGMFAHVPDFPPVAHVIRSELIELGVEPAHIRVESESASTFDQLRAALSEIRESVRSVIISNRYHLPRILAIIQVSDVLRPLSEVIAQKKLTLMEAERILCERDRTEWEEKIKRIYESPEMKERYENENRGLSAIRSGTYVFR